MLALDIRGALRLGVLEVFFVFRFVDLFDTVGRTVGLAEQAGFVTPDGRIPRINRALMADSVATMTGALLGTSTVVTYIERAAGISEGREVSRLTYALAATFLLRYVYSAWRGEMEPRAGRAHPRPRLAWRRKLMASTRVRGCAPSLVPPPFSST